MTARLCLAALIPFGLSTASADAQGPVRAEGALADSLRRFAVEMVQRLRDRDVDGVIALYGDTLHFVHVDGGRVIPWSVLAPSMRRYLSSATSNPLSIVGEPGVTLIDANNAVIHATHRFEGAPGHPPHEGVWTGVVHRFREGWRIVHSHSSDREPKAREWAFLAALSTASARRTAEAHLGFRLVRFDTLARGVSVALLERDGFHLEVATLPGSRSRLEALAIPTNNGSLQGVFKLGFWVSDADSAARALTNRGVALYRNVMVDSTLAGGVRSFLVRDPDSTVVQIFGPLR